MSDDVEERLAAVERALTGSDADLPALAADAELTDRVDAAEERLDAIEERIEELDAATQAVRGYVGNVRSVNEDVERRANAAVAGVEALEARVDDLEAGDAKRDRAPDGPRPDARRPNGAAGTPAGDDGPDGLGENRSEPASETPPRERSRDDSRGDGPDDSGVVARLRDAL